MAPEIDGKVYITDLSGAEEGTPPQPGTMATVEITRAHDYDLVGRVVEMVSRSAGIVPADLHGQRDAGVTTPVARVPIGAPLRILA